MSRFGGGKDADEVTVKVEMLERPPLELKVKPMTPEEIPEAWYV